MRGSSALLGAVDTSIEVKNTGDVICLKNEKQKDHAEHPPIYLKMKEIVLIDGSSVILELISSDGGKNPLESMRLLGEDLASEIPQFKGMEDLPSTIDADCRWGIEEIMTPSC